MVPDVVPKVSLLTLTYQGIFESVIARFIQSKCFK